LSIQNHPNSEAAKILHAQFPHSYDPNPKPEASIALTEVELLYGFRPETEILNYMRTVEPFGQFFEAGQMDELVGLEQNGLRSEFLELACTLVLEGENKAQNNETKAKALCKELYATLETKTRESLSAEERWILELSQQYPKGDVGCFFFYLLNLVTLKPGTCQYIATGIPHAYLKGEMLEFMYSSDNTLRAGLTPKDKDIETLLKITDFASTTSGITAAEPADNGSLRFSFPAEANFAVSVMKGPNTYECKADSIGILISPDATGSINDETRITPYGMWLAPAALATYQVSLESGSLYLLQSA
jgi:mannose-6-phosphate isomerase